MSIAIFVSCMFVSTTSAQLAGHNVLFIHGFIPEDLLVNPSDEEIYAREEHSAFWRERSEGLLNWSCAERVEGCYGCMILN